MNEKVRQLNAVPNIDPIAAIANGLEEAARNLRKHALPFSMRRCVLVCAGGNGTEVAVMYFGADGSVMETIGMLELAKVEIFMDAEQG